MQFLCELVAVICVKILHNVTAFSWEGEEFGHPKHPRIKSEYLPLAVDTNVSRVIDGVFCKETFYIVVFFFKISIFRLYCRLGQQYKGVFE